MCADGDNWHRILMRVCLTYPKLSGSFVVYWLEGKYLNGILFPHFISQEMFTNLRNFPYGFPSLEEHKVTDYPE